jgi:hypothetical protein
LTEIPAPPLLQRTKISLSQGWMEPAFNMSLPVNQVKSKSESNLSQSQMSESLFSGLCSSMT